MIQRKQSIYLFIAAMLNAGVFYFSLYTYHIFTSTATTTGTTNTDTLFEIKVNDHYPLLLIAVVMTILPLITIFMFGNRKRQTRLSFISILAILSFITMALNKVAHLSTLNPPPTHGSYWLGSILPAISLVFIFLAIFGIRRDEKLVKSVDRLR